MYIIQVKQDWLETIAPSGSSRWLGLFHTESAPDGTGFVENAVARVEIDSWVTNLLGEYTVERTNTLLIEYPPLADHILDVVSWGLFDASVAGNLLATDRFRDSVLYSFKPGEVPRFQPGEIRLLLDPAPIDTPGTDPDPMTCVEFQTTDATPQVFNLGTILDGEAKHVDVIVKADGFDGFEGKHYWRRSLISFERLDSDSGLTIWDNRVTTTEGDETRIRLTSATANLDHDGTDKVEVNYTGEAATSLNWRICWTGIE